ARDKGQVWTLLRDPGILPGSLFGWRQGQRNEVQDVHMKRNAALRALPLYLREEDPEFFKSWSAEEVDRPDITNTPVAIVSMVTEGTPSE
ncbi:hypothetical protein KUCAC02_004660, partial [Chaenocephalus aceratus]